MEAAKTVAALALMAAIGAGVIVSLRPTSSEPSQTSEPSTASVVSKQRREFPGHRLKIVDAEPGHASRHRYGRSADRLRVPECPTCRSPYAVIFEIDATDPGLAYLRLGAATRLDIVTCLGCDVATAGTFFYRIKNSPPTIEVVKAPASRAGRPWKNACPPRNVELRALGDADYPDTYDDLRDFRRYLEGGSEKKHQLGGKPFWVKGRRVMKCPECDGSMRYVAQIESETWEVPDAHELAGHTFGESAMLYVEVCDRCGIIGTAADVP